MKSNSLLKIPKNLILKDSLIIRFKVSLRDNNKAVIELEIILCSLYKILGFLLIVIIIR